MVKAYELATTSAHECKLCSAKKFERDVDVGVRHQSVFRFLTALPLALGLNSMHLQTNVKISRAFRGS